MPGVGRIAPVLGTVAGGYASRWTSPATSLTRP